MRFISASNAPRVTVRVFPFRLFFFFSLVKKSFSIREIKIGRATEHVREKRKRKFDGLCPRAQKENSVSLQMSPARKSKLNR